MTPEFLLGIFSAATLCIIFHLFAGNIYDLHYKLKQGGSPLTKVLTADAKNIENKELWVKRYRAKVMVMMAIILMIPVYRYFIE